MRCNHCAGFLTFIEWAEGNNVYECQSLTCPGRARRRGEAVRYRVASPKEPGKSDVLAGRFRLGV